MFTRSAPATPTTAPANDPTTSHPGRPYGGDPPRAVRRHRRCRHGRPQRAGSPAHPPDTVEPATAAPATSYTALPGRRPRNREPVAIVSRSLGSSEASSKVRKVGRSSGSTGGAGVLACWRSGPKLAGATGTEGSRGERGSTNLDGPAIAGDNVQRHDTSVHDPARAPVGVARHPPPQQPADGPGPPPPARKSGASDLRGV